jgi:gluconolactonase
LFSDIGNRIYRFDPRSGKTTVYREDSGKANGLMFDQQGRLIACEGANGGKRRITITERGQEAQVLADAYEGKKFNSPNDVAVAPNGDVYFTDPRYVGDEPQELDFEAVFLIRRQSDKPQLRVATRELQKPNGILIAADGKTAYVADNNGAADGNHHLVAFAIKADGTFGEKRILFDFGPHRRGIDGMTLDQEGNIYATAGSGKHAGIYVFDPQGANLAFVPVPGAPTNCVFGRGDEQSTLYITAAGPGEGSKYALYRITLKKPGYHVYQPE